MALDKRYTNGEWPAIELDCAPGAPRPGDLFPGVVHDTAVFEEDFEQKGRFFGNWSWYLKPEAADRYEIAKPEIERRIKALYASGRIRYGSY